MTFLWYTYYTASSPLCQQQILLLIPVVSLDVVPKLPKHDGIDGIDDVDCIVFYSVHIAVAIKWCW